MDKLKPLYLSLVIILLASLVLAFVASTRYGLSYKEINFTSQESRDLVLETRPIGPTLSVVIEPMNDGPISPLPTIATHDPEPIRNTTWYANGSKFESIKLMDCLIFSDGGKAVRENQVAAEEMEQSAQIYSWSYTILDVFEDVAKAEKKLEDLLEWVSFKVGITNMLSHLERFTLSRTGSSRLSSYYISCKFR